MGSACRCDMVVTHKVSHAAGRALSCDLRTAHRERGSCRLTLPVSEWGEGKRAAGWTEFCDVRWAGVTVDLPAWADTSKKAAP